jgi:nucleoside-diphosphate-sugar epimerase
LLPARSAVQLAPVKALVTGGAGFIGSHLVEALCSRGISVTVLDDFSFGSAENLAHIRGSPEVIQGSVSDRKLLQRAVQQKDWVFHFAAYASVPYSIEQPEITNEINLNSTLALLTECRAAGVKKVIFSSSSSVYGNRADLARESDAVSPLSPYALQKFAAEQYVRMFNEFRGLPGTALRYFNVFGPRQSFSSPYSGVIARFCTAIVNHQRPTIFGDGSQSRDFVSVRDVVQANLLATEKNEANGRVFNIGTGKTTSILELARTLNRIRGTSLEPIFEPGRSGEIQFSCADISAAKQVLGFSPKVSLEEGLRETLDFYRPGAALSDSR